MSPAFTQAQGVLGIEGIHNIAGYIDMNHPGNIPRIKLDRIAGMHSLPDLDDRREANYGRGQEQVYPSLTRGKTITYEGRVIAKDIWSMRQTMRDLRWAATHGRLGEGYFEVRPNPGAGGSTYRFYARILTFETDDEQTRGPHAVFPHQRAFILTARLGDPRYFLVGADYVASGANAQIITVNNTGTAVATPTFVVNGPVPGNLTFTRYDNFVLRKLVYGAVGLAAGQQLILDFQARSLKRASDGASYEHKRIFDDSNWWDMGAAGLNTGLTNVSVTGGGTWSISFAPADW